MPNKQVEEAEQKRQHAVEIISEMRKIAKRLPEAAKWGLEVEVIAFALDTMKANPNFTLSEAFHLGCCEWDV
jgi:hypothetical protein